MIRALELATCLAALLSVKPAWATQATIPQPTSGPATMGQLVANSLNPALQALLTNASGPSAPASPVAYQWWVDTSGTKPVLKIYDGSQWEALASIDLVAHTITWSGALTYASLPAIANLQVLAYIGGGSSGQPGGVGVSALLDAAFGSTQGQIICRASGGWGGVAAAQAGYVLTYNGTGTCPTPQPVGVAGVPNVTSFSNLKVTNGATPASQVTVTADTLVLKGASNGLPVSGVNNTCATGSSGANGVDSPPATANTGYYVWEISTGSGAACLLSTSSTAPAMPSGYVYKMRVGWTSTDNTITLARITQIGRRAQYVGVAGSGLVMRLVTSGIGGSNVATPTYAAVPLAGVIAATAASVYGTISNPSSSGSTILAAPNSNYGAYNSASNPPPVSIIAALGSAPFTFVLESTSIYYATNVASAGVFISGWEDNL